MSTVEVGLAVARTRQATADRILAFYARPIGWIAWIVTSLFLAGYAGGGVMFWWHCIIRGEKGPPIDNWYHWLLDSSLGFVGLSPVLFFILPTALTAVSRTRIQNRSAKAALYVLLVGALFAIATGPGPVLHYFLVGRGTWGAGLAVKVFGYDHGVAVAAAHVPEHSLGTECVLQVLVGIPVYIAMSLFAFGIIRTIAPRLL